MSLKEKLEATRAASASRVPADKRAIMERATADASVRNLEKRRCSRASGTRVHRAGLRRSRLLIP